MWTVGREPSYQWLCKEWGGNHYQHLEIWGCPARSVAFSRGIKPTCSNVAGRRSGDWNPGLNFLPSSTVLLVSTATHWLIDLWAPGLTAHDTSIWTLRRTTDPPTPNMSFPKSSYVRKWCPLHPITHLKKLRCNSDPSLFLPSRPSRQKGLSLLCPECTLAPPASLHLN